MIKVSGNISGWEVNNDSVPRTITIYFPNGIFKSITGALVSIECDIIQSPDGDYGDNYATEIVIANITHFKEREDL